jgi:type IV fimbrial biogenesis protein FimT
VSTVPPVAPWRVSAGFTLVELLVTMSVLAVLLALAAPSFRDLLAAQRIRSAVQSLVSDLLLARSEAVKRGAPVTLSGAAEGWEQGWQVSANAGADVLSAQNALGADLSVEAPEQVVFDRNGRTDALVAFEIRHDQAPTRCIVLDPSGRPKTLSSACPTSSSP